MFERFTDFSPCLFGQGGKKIRPRRRNSLRPRKLLIELLLLSVIAKQLCFSGVAAAAAARSGGCSGGALSLAAGVP